MSNNDPGESLYFKSMRAIALHKYKIGGNKFMKKIQAISRGKDKGTILSPHFYTEGYFKITKGRKSDDHNRRVFSEHELESWVQKGYGIRMSARGHPSSTFMPQSLVLSLDCYFLYKGAAPNKLLNRFMPIGRFVSFFRQGNRKQAGSAQRNPAHPLSM